MINKILTNHVKSCKCFLGCFPADKIPKSDIYPYAAIINTDKYGYPGTHWVAIYVPNKLNIEYFDSFGELPNETIIKYLLNFENIHLNKLKIQSLFSDVCGHFCIFYIIKRCRNIAFKKIIQKFCSKKNPDFYVKSFVLGFQKHET